MSDLRYHVASLAAVFLALVLGIVVGVGLSGSGLVEEGERRNLNAQIAALRNDLDDANRRIVELEQDRVASAEVSRVAYPVLMRGRLDGLTVGRVFVGQVDEETLRAVDRAVGDAGGTSIRLRALRVPLDLRRLAQAARRGPFRQLGVEELGRSLAEEFVAGGAAGTWDAVSPFLVEERSGSLARRVDAVVVVRTAGEQRGPTARFLDGFYAGLDGVPAVGAERSTVAASTIAGFERAGLSSVDNVDAVAGRVALALLLGGATPGHYGVKDTASSVLPAFEPVVPTTAGG